MTHTPADDPPVRDPSEAAGDSGDQAQDLQAALEAEAIAAALGGHPRGSSEVDRAAGIEELENEDPLMDPIEGDASDDPFYGGDDLTGREPNPRA